MKLVMFDIDGTLTRTFAVDADCFAAAVCEASGLPAISTDWASYEHTTDSGILEEVYRTRLGQAVSSGETDAVRRLFIGKLQVALAVSPVAFEAIPGAREIVRELGAQGYAVALASGGWRDSAELKLHAAGLRLESVPAAFADDALSRFDIMRCAYRRSCAAWNVSGFECVISIGDGTWDAKAARQLGWPFIGVGEGERARCLRELGAVATLGDYSDLQVVLEKIRFAFGSFENVGSLWT